MMTYRTVRQHAADNEAMAILVGYLPSETHPPGGPPVCAPSLTVRFPLPSRAHRQAAHPADGKTERCWMILRYTLVFACLIAFLWWISNMAAVYVAISESPCFEPGGYEICALEGE